jgi:xylulokinase
MLCYMNGAAAREQIRDRYAGGKWSGFNELVQATPPGCNGYFGLYFPWQEIIPPNVRGCFFFLKQDGRPVQPIPITDMPENAHPRAVLESQFLSIRSRIKAIWPPNTPSTGRLIVTGGASSNPRVLQVAADVFGMSVFVVDDSTEAAATGGALLARYAWWRRERQSGSLDEMMSSMRMHGIVRGNIRTAAEPQDESLAQLYEKLVGNYVDCEGHVVQMRLSADPNV